MGTIDRGIRFSVALVLGGVLVSGQYTGVWFWIMTVLAIVFALTASIRICPLYLPLKLNTKTKKEGDSLNKR